MRQVFGGWLSRFIVGAMVMSYGVARSGAGGIPTDPWADTLISYVPGSGASPSYLDASTTLGEPERFTGEGGAFPGAVTVFNPAFGTDEIVSIGAGGSLVVEFSEPISNDAGHLFGVDLIIFGNGAFVDADPADDMVDDETGLFGPTFGLDQMRVSVSADGASWVSLGAFTEGLFPAQGYLDTPAFSDTPGTVLSNFTKPVDPSLTVPDFIGKTYGQVLGMYAESGGGTPIDIGPSGLPAVSFVRVENLTPGTTVEIDAFATVPEPPSAGVVGAVLSWLALRRKR